VDAQLLDSWGAAFGARTKVYQKKLPNVSNLMNGMADHMNTY